MVDEPVKCNQTTCSDPAIARVFWPGREPLPMCLEHALKAKGISQVMGFHLPIEPLVVGARRP